MRWHRQRCPTGDIKITVGETQDSVTAMADLTKARLLVNVLYAFPADRLCSFMQILRTFHPRKPKKPSRPVSCAAPAMLCAVALLQPGACCLAMIPCARLPLV